MWPFHKKEKSVEPSGPKMVRCEECKHQIEMEYAQKVMTSSPGQSCLSYVDMYIYFCPMHQKPYQRCSVSMVILKKYEKGAEYIYSGHWGKNVYKYYITKEIEVDENGKEVRKK